MGYSVYLKIKPNHFPKIERFIHSKELSLFLRENRASKICGNFVVDNDLSYINDDHLINHRLVGVNYGDYDGAHTMVRALAVALKRKWYEYDGVERMTVDQKYFSSEMRLADRNPEYAAMHSEMEWAKKREAVLSDMFHGIINI